MKKKIIVSVIVSLIVINITYAWLKPKTTICIWKKWYELYECRYKKLCLDKIIWSETQDENYQIITKPRQYENADKIWKLKLNSSSSHWLDLSDNYNDIKLWNPLKPYVKASTDFRENINDIYKCSIINIQKDSLKVIKEELISLDKTWELSKWIWKKIDRNIKKLDKASKICKNNYNKDNTKSSSNPIYKKDIVLNEVTYETCKYISYLEYLKEYYSNPSKALWIDNINENANKTALWRQFSIDEVSSSTNKVIYEINNEIAHTKKVFPIAFGAYVEYESNYPIHALLWLLKEDFILLRKYLYKSINPINQVVYKISNAMSK